jgi:molecular chaperone GrpE
MSETEKDGNGRGSKPPGIVDDEPTDPGAARAASASFVEAPTDPGAKPLLDPLIAAQGEVAEMKDKYLRLAADFDNFRKRARRENDDAERRGRENLLKDVLPVFDNLERAVIHAEQATDAKSVADGVRMVLKQFLDTIERVGIRRVPTTGQSFDPNVHEAIQQLETSEHAPGTIVAEVQPGYLIGDKLVRAAMVVVAKAPQAS